MPRIDRLGEIASDSDEDEYEGFYSDDDESYLGLNPSYNRLPIRCGRRKHYLTCGHWIATNTYACLANCSHRDPKIRTHARFDCIVCHERDHQERLEGINAMMKAHETDHCRILLGIHHFGLTPQQIENLEDQLADQQAWAEELRFRSVGLEWKRYRRELTDSELDEELAAAACNRPIGPELEEALRLLQEQYVEEFAGAQFDSCSESESDDDDDEPAYAGPFFVPGARTGILPRRGDSSIEEEFESRHNLADSPAENAETLANEARIREIRAQDNSEWEDSFTTD